AGNSEDSQKEADKTANDSNGQRLRKNKEEHDTIRVADGFKNGEFGSAFTNGDGHSVAGHEKQGEENNGADGDDEEFDVAELLDPTGGESGFTLRLGFIGRVGEFGIDGFGNPNGILGAVQAKHVPA